MSFRYSIKDIAGVEPYPSLVDRYGQRPSSAFEDAFMGAQYMPSSLKKWGFLNRVILPITNPDNPAEAFLVCNIVRHVDHEGEMVRNRSFGFFGKACGFAFEDKVSERATYYQDFRHFAFERLARRFNGTVLGEFAQMVTVPYPSLIGKKDPDIQGLFYIAKPGF